MRLAFIFFCIFLLCVPFSVTISQAFAILSFLSYFASRFPKFKDFPWLFWILLFLYLSILFARIWANDYKIEELTRLLTHSEFSDIWMIFLLIPASNLSRKRKTKVKQILNYVSILLIISGIISLFFPYRLSTFVMDGFSYVDGRRLPHQIAYLDFISLPLFLPIGFQNTHLTYGGLLALFSPSLFLYTYRLKVLKYKIGYLYLFLSTFALLLLLLNQSRSIWLGLIIATILIIPKNQAIRSLKKYLLVVTIVTGILLCMSYLLYSKNWLFQRSIDQLFTKQTLENQRAWIHKANFKMMKESPYLGIGTGNYPKFFESSYLGLIDEKPYLYYEISITPKSHAHHDFLHFFILGGIFSAVLFLICWIQITKQILSNGKHRIAFMGIYAIFIGGMFQCYFLDDEILLPLLGLVSLLLNKHKFGEHLKKSIAFSIIPLTFSIFSLYNLSQVTEDSLFFHRTRDAINHLSSNAQKTINGDSILLANDPSDSFYFKLEGCLSHKANLDGKKEIRTVPLKITIVLPEINDQSNLPSRCEMELRERDAFDQDKHFKAHKESVLQSFNTNLRSGNNLIELEIPKGVDSSEIKFYDFGIKYLFDAKEKKRLPKILLHENCD